MFKYSHKVGEVLCVYSTSTINACIKKYYDEKNNEG